MTTESIGTRPSRKYGVAVFKNVMVPMRDGVRLATDIYRPTQQGSLCEKPCSTILGRTAYDKSDDVSWVKPLGDFFCREGYNVVCQDVRGRGASEGVYRHTADPTQGSDGYDTIEWIAAQPWSDGKVGMTGSSQAAIAQQTAALHRPPHLVCIWPDVGPVNSYQHFARRGGVLALHVFGSLMRHAHDLPAVAAAPATQDAIGDALVHMEQWLGLMPFRPGGTPLALVPELEHVFFDYYYRGCYDDFWAQEGCDQSRHWERHADIPGMFSGGWFDPFAAGTVSYFGARRASSTKAQKLLLGPWTHETMRTESTSVGDADFGPAAAWGTSRYQEELLAFFGRYLRDEPAWDAVPAARTFVMGGGSGRRKAGGRIDHGGRWRVDAAWPPQGIAVRPYYLWADGSMRLDAPRATEAFVPFRFDPSRPVPTLGGAFQGLYRFPRSWRDDSRYVRSAHLGRNLTPPGPRDQRVRTKRGGLGNGSPIAARTDVLVFETEPLAQDTEVTGEVVVELWVSSSAPDTDFTVKLVDAYPPSRDFPSGIDLAISGTIFRARYRDGWDHETFMRPDRRYRLRFNLPPTSNLFAARHRIRVYISSSDHPQFEVNPNTGDAPGRHATTSIAINRVHTSRDAASRVLLPVG